MNVTRKLVQLAVASLACAGGVLFPAIAARGVTPVPPYQFVRTIQVAGETQFGSALAEYQGNLLISAADKAYLFNLATGAQIQSYNQAGSGGSVVGYDNKVAVGSSTGTGT